MEAQVGRDSSAKAFMRELRKVIEKSDVIIQVLDARDPEGTRSRWVEDQVRKHEADGKKLLAVINKIGGSYRILCFGGELTLSERPSAAVQLRSLDKVSASFFRYHAIQIIHPVTTPSSVSELCPSRIIVLFLFPASPYNRLVSRGSRPTPPPKTIRSLNTSFVPHRRRSRLSQRRQIFTDKLAQEEPSMCSRCHAREDESNAGGGPR